ncbi:MAG: parallel beta-helix repeat protein [Cyclobacteriaceae bacterium]|jgi:parallel beta-helix repeat protein
MPSNKQHDKMKKLLIFILLLTSIRLYAQTSIGGTITTNTTYTAANSPYTVTSTLTINAGVTLSIESGAILNFNDNLKLDVNGTLIADGVTFTSSNASPTAGIWGGIELDGNTTNTLINCQILYANYGVRATYCSFDISGTSITNSRYEAIYIANNTALDFRTDVTADNLTISGTSAGYNGIYADRTNLALSNSSISNVGNYGVYFKESLTTNEAASTSSSISNTTITNATQAGIGVNSGVVSINNVGISSCNYPIQFDGDADVSYSGTNSFANNSFNVILLSQASITKNLTLRNSGYLYYFNGNKTVENGAELTITSGNIIKMSINATLSIKGKLTAKATTDETITFTTWYDDNTGGDSNRDSNDTSPATGKWYGIHFQNESDDASSIDGATIKWTQYYGGVTTYNASPTISNNTISNCYYGAMFNGASSPTFSNNTIAASDQTPIAMSFDANPSFTDNVFSSSDNVYDAIGLLGGTLSQNGTIVQRNFTDIDNVTYVMLGSVIVPSGLSLNIASGIVIKSESAHNFQIQGELIADGAPEEPIIFTSVHDDNFGNPLDTKNDGTNQVPAVGNFGGIYFGETSVNTSLIDNATIKFANYTAQYQYETSPVCCRYYYYRSAIAINRSSPTISNCRITDARNGIDMRGLASPVITDNTITNTEFAPFRQAIQTTPSYTGNTFNSVGWKGVGILPEQINYTATLNKQAVAGFDNILYIFESMAISETAKVTIGEGVFIKMPTYNKIDVYGGFKIAGTELDPVTITSMADDNNGPYTNPLDNDTESNGNATEPTSQKWGSIHYYGTSDDTFSSISHARLLYGGYDQAPIRWNQASANVDHTEISFSQYYGMYFEGASTPTIDNVSISTSGQDPLAMSYFANPTFTNITFNANGSNGINLIDTQLNADATVAKRDIAGINNIGYIMNNLSIANGAILTINPGVVLKLQNKRVDVYEGAINAVGTTSEKIIFTSVKDDSRGGDTNIDGNGSAPAPGDWYGIYFRESTMQSQLKYTEVRYGGDAENGNSAYGYPREGTIISENNNLIVDNCVIQLSSSSGFGAYGTSAATFTSNRLENISRFPVHLAMFSNPTFSGNTVENIGYFAIGVRQESYNQSGTFPFRSFAGVDSITYMPTDIGVTYSALVNSGTKITIPAGMHFKLASSSYMEVNGELHIAGTAANPVVFTTLNDDNYGRPLDTQGDGLPLSWQLSKSGTLVKFNNISNDNSLIENTVIRYKNNAIELVSASPTLDNNLFDFSNWGIVSTGISEPTYTNNTFKDLEYAPFTTSMVAYPASTSGNMLEGTTWKTIHINNETLTQDTTLYKRSFAGITNIPYSFNNYTVGLGVKLTIEPGVIVKISDLYRPPYPYANGSFTIKGALEANGGPNSDETIIFTSMHDDFYGGDSNSDSTYTSSIYNEFDKIVFTNESSDSESILNNVIIRGADSYGVELQSASPTITNTLFWDNGYSSNLGGGLYITGASNPVLANNDFIDNGSISGTTRYGFGINNTGSFTVNATECWWGDNSGPYHATLNTAGKGDVVMGNVTFDPWATDNSLNPITGDVSLNGRVSAYDAALTLQEVAAIITFEARQTRAGDVSGDGTVSAMDASYILQFAAGLIQSFPAEAESKRIEQQFASTYSNAVVTIGNATLSELFTEVSIPITVANVAQLHALTLKLPLGDHLEFLGFEKEESLHFSPTLNVSEGNVFNLTFGLMNGLTEDFKLGNLKLKLKSERVNSTSIALISSHLVGNETDISSLAQNGELYVTGAILRTNNDMRIQVYPNPMVNHATVTMPNHEGARVTAQWVDVSGKIMFEKATRVANGKIAFKDIRLNPGIYFIKIKGDQIQFEERIIVGQ